MSQPPPPVPPQQQTDELQFDTAEPASGPASGAGPAAATCAGCGQPITDVYFTAGEKVVCPRCRAQYVASMSGGSAVGRLGKAAVFGAIAALVGAAIWYGVRRATGYEIGLIAIVVGFLVGAAVRAGSGGRGGRGYQVLALLLTYAGICANYVPDIYSAGIDDGASPGPLLFAIAVVLSLAAPFLAGVRNIIGILIIAFALWEAWRMNTGQPKDLAGPYMLGGAPGAPPPPLPPPPAPGIR